ncbi:predicted protein [Naegleria gruberi]|uniref:Predicted protein n=1 Tax=Naegleria gruberi TaxID=5762 RepID=D2VJF5_NAEGR|nr:uncharacterized protein NAEGRDRAFT_50042 [Naegleria gruberi]EFC43031.1 predicted protein [Naegleria gruberi]|eukprot:XP_002675775.1 predicted protein [Naegleria gruberi strain NEG-M]
MTTKFIVKLIDGGSKKNNEKETKKESSSSDDQSAKWNVLLKMRNSIQKQKKKQSSLLLSNTLKTQFAPSPKTNDSDNASCISLDFASSTIEGNIQSILASHIAQLKVEYLRWKSSQKSLSEATLPIDKTTNSNMFLSCPIENNYSNVGEVDMLMGATFRKEQDTTEPEKKKSRALFDDKSDQSLSPEAFKKLVESNKSKAHVLIQDEAAGKTKFILDSLLSGDSYLLYFDFAIDMREFERRHQSVSGNFYVGNKFSASSPKGSKSLIGKAGFKHYPKAQNLVHETFYENLLQKFGSATKSGKEKPMYMNPTEHCKNFYIVRRSFLLLIYVHMFDLLAYLQMKKDRKKLLESSPTTPTESTNTRRSTRQKKPEENLSKEDLEEQGDASPMDYYLFRKFENTSLSKIYTTILSNVNTKFTSQQFCQYLTDYLIGHSQKSESVNINLVFDQIQELVDHSKFLYIYKSRFDHDGCQTQVPEASYYSHNVFSNIFGNSSGNGSELLSGNGSSSYQPIIEPVMDAIQYFSKHAEEGVSRVLIGRTFTETAGTEVETSTSSRPRRSTTLPKVYLKEKISLLRKLPLKQYELTIVPDIYNYSENVENIKKVFSYYFPLVDISELIENSFEKLLTEECTPTFNNHILFDTIISGLLKDKFTKLNSKKASDLDPEQEWLSNALSNILFMTYPTIFSQNVQPEKKRKRAAKKEAPVDFENLELPDEDEEEYQTEEEEEKKPKKSPKKKSTPKKETKKKKATPKKEKKVEKKEKEEIKEEQMAEKKEEPSTPVKEETESKEEPKEEPSTPKSKSKTKKSPGRGKKKSTPKKTK